MSTATPIQSGSPLTASRPVPVASAVSPSVRNRQTLLESSAGIPFTRLVRVEARKFIDTRAGKWLLISAGIVALLGAAGGVALAKYISRAEGGAVSWQAFGDFVGIGVLVLLPVMAILLVTSEWSQRTALTTFTLEPRRMRVIAAKATVLLIGTLVAGTTLLALDAATAVVAQQAMHVSIDWSLGWRTIVGSYATLLLSLLSAFGFGLVLMNSPAAIVASLVLPNLYSMLTMFPATRKIADWTSLGLASGPVNTLHFEGNDIWRLLVASLIWIIVPVVGGLIRHQRTEVK